ncbi:hypothetical protein EDB84DRAFT_1258875 [Lactarius hengduanensis]|nr:hypothetical protein EDB84DRAFT_1258875 [Lactarius hengduanensis]
MTTWKDFLSKHAKFPFPQPVEGGYVSTTDISTFGVALLDGQWKARYAIQDKTLPHKLCQTLEDILGDKCLPDGSEDKLLSMFGRHLEFSSFGGREWMDKDWRMNASESETRTLLDKGFFRTAGFCLGAYGGYCFHTMKEASAQGGDRSKVDYVGLVDDEPVILVEAKSPSIMKAVGDLLPPHGFKLKWLQNQPPVPKIFQKAALYLGQRKMEWLFLTSHNSWIICRLVRGVGSSTPFLAYSQILSIENSSVPFRAFLGAVLSVQGGAPVQASELNHRKLDIIAEDVDNGPLPEDNIDDGSGAYRGGPRTNTFEDPMTRSRYTTTSHGAAEPVLMVTSSPAHTPEPSQVWVHLHPLSNNIFILPHCTENGNVNRRLWLTRLIGFGSTGNVWQCYFDNSDGFFATKVVELLRKSDVERQRRFCQEFGVYLTLEMAYQSGQLRDRITPHCYGAFRGDGVDVLILELCGGTLKGWGELDISERTQLYVLVCDLHRVGILHGDLEPRNIARIPGGGFRLIDFSESRRHNCVDIPVRWVAPFT